MNNIKHLNKAEILRRYKRNEQHNLHGENALLLVGLFGTEEENKEVEEINARHEKRGHITLEDFTRREELSNKYYKLIKR